MIRCPLYKKKSVFGKGILQRSNEVPLSLLQTLLCCFVPCHSCRGNAIHTYTGVQLRLACHSIMRKQGKIEPPGQEKLTKVYLLLCDFILHTEGPVINGVLTDKDRGLFASCF